MIYHDLILKITENQIFLAREANGKSNERQDRFSADPVLLLAVQRLHYWLNHSLHRLASTQGLEKPCEVADLEAMGLLLHDLIFRGRPQIQELFEQARVEFDEAARAAGDERLETIRLRLHLVLDGASSDLAALPWEFLYVPPKNGRKGFFFSGQKIELILSRYTPDKHLEANLKPLPSPLKILVIFSRAGPQGLTIDAGEVQSLKSMINDTNPSQVDVSSLDDPTYDEVSEKIQEIHPHIVHYIGHGEPGQLALSKAQDDPDYDQKLPDPQLRWINGQQFKLLFSNPPRPRLVFLHACKGAAFEFFKSLSSTAQDLVDAGIPAVVAMQYNISNADAGLFARCFYGKLGEGQSIDEAVKSGRVLLGKRFPTLEHPRFGTPVLYMQCRTAIVLPPAAEASAEKSAGAVTASASLPSPARGPASAAGTLSAPHLTPPPIPGSSPGTPAAPSLTPETMPASVPELAVVTEVSAGSSAAAAGIQQQP